MTTEATTTEPTKTPTEPTKKPTKRLTKDDVILLFSDASGQYIPQRFANEIRRECIRGADPADLACLEAGPTEDNEWYWEAWDCVLQTVELVVPRKDDPSVVDVYYLWQDGDCWAVPVGVTVDDMGRFANAGETELHEDEDNGENE